MLSVTRIKGPDNSTIALNIVIDTAESIEVFKELVNRATNLWPDATPEVKEFADVVTNEGKVWQDYESQNTSKIKPVCVHEWPTFYNMTCRCIKCGKLKRD